MLSAKRLQVGGRVDVGDRHQVGRVDHFAELVPAVLNLLDGGHIGQRAAGGLIGQDHCHPPPVAAGDLLGPVGQDVGGLGHEMDAAKGDRPALLVLGGQLGQLVTVAAEVRQSDDLVLLVVVAQDQEPRAHLRPHPLDAHGEDRVFQRLIGGQLEGRRER